MAWSREIVKDPGEMVQRFCHFPLQTPLIIFSTTRGNPFEPPLQFAEPAHKHTEAGVRRATATPEYQPFGAG